MSSQGYFTPVPLLSFAVSTVGGQDPHVRCNCKTAMVTPIPASVRAPLKAPQWALRGHPTGPPCRRPLRIGSRPSGRPHDERPPLHGDRTPPLTASRLRALRRAHARPPASLCPRAAAPRGLLLHGAAWRGGSCLGGLGAAAEAEEEIDLVLTIAPIKCLRPRAGEA
jgi:hypothetical protein